MDTIRRIYQTLFVSLLCIAVSSCADMASGVTKGVLDKVLEDDPAEVVIRLKADPDINPDPQGRASPIVVRIYELKSPDIFNTADFFALYEEDGNILGEEMKARNEMEVSPGEQVEIEKILDIETHYVGVMAAYRDLDNAVWRGTIETPLDETTYIDVTLGRLTLRVEKGEKKGGFLGF